MTIYVTAFTALTAPFNGVILRRELGASAFQLSALASANAACLLLSLGMARVIDSRRPLPYVVWPGLAARGLFLLIPFIHSPWPFLVLIATATLFGTMSGPAQTALVQQVYPPGQRGRALGTMRVVGGVFGVAVATVSGPLMARLGYRWMFWCAGMLGMVASLRQRRLPVPAPAPTAPPQRPALREAWLAMRDDHSYRRALLGSFVFGSGIWVMMPATPLVLADVVGVTTAQVGLLAAVASVAALAGNVLWGRLVDRGSSLAVLRTVYVVGIATPVAYYTIQVMARSPWSLTVTSVCEALLATGLDLVWTIVVIDFAGPQRTAQYAAISGTLAGVRGVVGPLLGAAIIQWWGLHAVYLVAASLMTCGAWLVTRQLRQMRNCPTGLVARPAPG